MARELSGDDIVRIINAASKAKMKRITIGDLVFVFKDGDDFALPQTFSGYSAPAEDAQQELFSDDEQDDLALSQLSVTDPVAWEESQLNPEKFE